jgi:hypothetical protein
LGFNQPKDWILPTRHEDLKQQWGIAMKVSIDLMKPGGDLSFAQIMTQRPSKKPSVGLESLFGGHMKGVIQ